VRHALYPEIGSAFNPVNGNYGVTDHDPGHSGKVIMIFNCDWRPHCAMHINEQE
jgi:hypothetical protein